ncbi:MAG: hypothetical protein WCV56_06315 [Candidatus Omnitrophota bacterium]
MKVTALLILLLGFQVSAYGEGVIAGGVNVPVFHDGALFEDIAKFEDGISAKSGGEEAEFLGDLIKDLLLSVRCEPIRDIENFGDMAVRASV